MGLSFIVEICLFLEDLLSYAFFDSRKGISGSAIPYRRRAPTWLKTTNDEVVDQITKLARKGLTPSQIGIQLRDSHGVGLVKNVTGSKVLRILKANGSRRSFLRCFCLSQSC